MTIDDPQVLAEVGQAVDAYEAALMANDLDRLDCFFHDAPQTVRFGISENLYGYAAIAAFRAGRLGGSPSRERLATHIAAYGRDMAVAHVEFQRPGAAQPGRQTQTWVRTPLGWKVVSAHVSLLSAGKDQREGQTG